MRACLIAPAVMVLAAQTPQLLNSFQLLRSVSGPSGKVVEDRFVMDETRNRFVYPQDKSFIVYFEWEGPAGTHALTAIWKGPDGRPQSISPDVKIETHRARLASYWTFLIVPGMPSGAWEVEVRIDGQPAGSHAFELVVPEVAAPKPAPARAAPTLDQLYRLRPAVVWVHRLDESGRRTDMASGFVIGPNQVATAFQAVDMAAGLEIEFDNGRRVRTEELWGWNRLEDWAVLKVDTEDAPPLRRADLDAVKVGERLVVFNAESEMARVIGGVDLGGRRKIAGFGERLHLNPDVSAGAIGGPLLNLEGEVVGILGGSVVPASRHGSRDMGLSPRLWAITGARNAATPISCVPESLAGAPVTLITLAQRGVLTPPLWVEPALILGGTASARPKALADGVPPSVSEFSRRDAQVLVYAVWQKKDKTKQGMTSAVVYDAQNRPRIKTETVKVRLSDQDLTRSGMSFPPAQLEAGTYRIDVFWNDRVVYRTFITVED